MAGLLWVGPRHAASVTNHVTGPGSRVLPPPASHIKMPIIVTSTAADFCAEAWGRMRDSKPHHVLKYLIKCNLNLTLTRPDAVLRKF